MIVFDDADVGSAAPKIEKALTTLPVSFA